MEETSNKGDTPLPIAASIACLLTFLTALLAAAWPRIDTVCEALQELEALGGNLEKSLRGPL